MGLDPKKLPPTFFKLFPETPNYEEKAIRILRTWHDHGCTKKGLSKALDISRPTAINLINALTETHIYSKFVDDTKRKIKGFTDPFFQGVIFDRYEREISALNQLITDTKKIESNGVNQPHPLKLELEVRKQKHAVMKAQLEAALKLASLKSIDKAVADTEQELTIEEQIKFAEKQAIDEKTKGTIQ